MQVCNWQLAPSGFHLFDAANTANDYPNILTAHALSHLPTQTLYTCGGVLTSSAAGSSFPTLPVTPLTTPCCVHPTMPIDKLLSVSWGFLPAGAHTFGSSTLSRCSQHPICLLAQVRVTDPCGRGRSPQRQVFLPCCNVLLPVCDVPHAQTQVLLVSGCAGVEWLY